ncbi:MAG: hypothetical protein H6878_03005 [Rhodobiaceae bacterium]|nr:hypothetical protein [Rhodobiaceae bacterium]MCC0042658.1 hypothetical protein [Rhodobiaceae bacterium]
MHSQNTNEPTASAMHHVDSSVGRALVAWLVMAILAVGFAAMVSVEASAAPFGEAAHAASFDRGFAALLSIAAAGFAFAVTFTMWRDLSRQTARAQRAGSAQSGL